VSFEVSSGYGDILFMPQGCAAAVTAPAGGAGQFNHAQLINPVGSGIVLRLYGLWLAASAGAVLMGVYTVGALGAVSGAPIFQDQRLPGTPACVSRLLTDATTSYSTRAFLYGALGVIAGLFYFTLPEGSSIVANNDTANATLRASFLWREDPSAAP
jgi:hypothetical protein